ncbi:4-hydroxy-tetrahydrodipicolinate synthase [Zhaonella formicivorans]|uniref:4-hydroxy-tetrahydrodipicolinate synthase n=1 Tax=Zhaonella formicivorans TaxID=2528593 RepID=UPI0010E93337|nr:4-hydroxy-tetrahydrodipicolinate synthase [Zhaonella formicivorans]
MQNNFGRVLTAMVTPFTPEDKLDLEGARKLASYLVANGSDGLVVAGTTGESPTLSKEEKLELFQAVKEAVGPNIPVLAGTGSYSTEDSIKQSQAAEQAGVDGLLVVAPYYNKPTQDGLYQHFKSIAENTALPIMLYNIPSRTGRNMLPVTVAKLAELDNILAIKESTGDMEQMTELRRLTPDDFLIYSGDDTMTLPMLALGGYGVVSVASHLVGSRIKAMTEAFINGNTAEALQIHLELFPLFKTMFITTNPIPVKTAMALMGHKVGGFRLPLVGATAEEEKIIAATLQKYGLLKSV